MKESEIRKKAVKLLQSEGWVVWWPPRTRYKSEDIFNIGDLIVWRRSHIKLIQLTTKTNMSTRRKKIEKFMTDNGVEGPVEVWGYDKKKKEFAMKIVQP